MQAKTNNRYREFTVAVPAHLADEIKRLAKLNGTSEAKFICDVLIKYLAPTVNVNEEMPIVTLNGEAVGTLVNAE